MLLVALWTLLVFFIPPTGSVWIGEEYWATVSKDGSHLLDGRSRTELARFEVTFGGQAVDAYVAYWITEDERGHHESYGQAWIEDGGRICGRFVGRWKNKVELCGGFRVLARHHTAGINPFHFVKSKNTDAERAVTYRGIQIARINAWQRTYSFLGSADLRHKRAYGIEYDSSLVEVEEQKDPFFFDHFVEVLVMSPYSEHYLLGDDDGYSRSYNSHFGRQNTDDDSDEELGDYAIL
ncbi:hypothetical protein QR680_010515 [Steinernema hermaphroditum]|uniref:Uncharacterized protein n=1 Tax=Steinernema hermaphroditum TaxID=289476 RepID=A0AA39IQV5_9BILA|nr:hypothetical protein QR680_010515 [Steinernema hermaphroditum]